MMRIKVLTLALLVTMTAAIVGCSISKPTEANIKTDIVETKTEEYGEAAEKIVTETQESTTKENFYQSSDGISREFKEAMDSYEAFFDEYVEFMKKYSESDDILSMMEDYTDYMTKYTDTMKKLDEIDEDNLSAAEYAYYIDVMARIQKKLLEAVDVM